SLSAIVKLWPIIGSSSISRIDLGKLMFIYCLARQFVMGSRPHQNITFVQAADTLILYVILAGQVLIFWSSPYISLPCLPAWLQTKHARQVVRWLGHQA